jgi:hypothetical protein
MYQSDTETGEMQSYAAKQIPEPREMYSLYARSATCFRTS